jgi:hypothetical protein
MDIENLRAISNKTAKSQTEIRSNYFASATTSILAFEVASKIAFRQRSSSPLISL